MSTSFYSKLVVGVQWGELVKEEILNKPITKYDPDTGHPLPKTVEYHQIIIGDQVVEYEIKPGPYHWEKSLIWRSLFSIECSVPKALVDHPFLGVSRALGLDVYYSDYNKIDRDNLEVRARELLVGFQVAEADYYNHSIVDINVEYIGQLVERMRQCLGQLGVATLQPKVYLILEST